MNNDKPTYEFLFQENELLKKQIEELKTFAKKQDEEMIIAKEKADWNELNFKKVQEIAHIGSWYLDIATNNVMWTDELYKMYNFDPTLSVPSYTEHMKLFTLESWEILSTSLANTRETGIPYELELKTVKKDGSNGWMWVRGEVVKDEKSKIIGLWGAAQDITQRKNIEIELQKAKEKAEENAVHLKTLIDTIPDLVWLKDKNGVYLNCNYRFEQFFGKPKNDILGKTDYDFVDKKLADFFREKDKVAITAEKPAMNEEEVTFASDGHSEILETTRTPVYNNHNQLIGVLGIGHDITVRKKSEQALKESEAKLSTIFKRANALISISDVKTGLFIDVNDYGLAFSGFSREEMIGHTAIEMGWITLENRILLIDVLQEKGRIDNFELSVRKKNGTIAHVITSGEIISIKGKEYLLTISVDITHRKHIEDQMLKMEKMHHETEKFGKIGGWEFDIENIRSSWTVGTFNIFEIDSNKGVPKLSGALTFIVPPFRQMAEEAITKSIVKGEPYDHEWKIVTEKGNVRWIHSIGKPYQVEGKTKKVIGSFQDITERKLAENKAIEAFEKLSNAEVIAKMGNWSWNPNTNEVLWSDNMCRLYGIEPSQFNPTFDYANRYTHPDDLDYVSKIIERLLTEKKPQPSAEYRILTSDNKTVWVEGKTQLLFDEKGEINEVVGTTQDITERKQIQETIVAKNKEMENYLYVASHDLRTPLVNIQGFSMRLKKQADSIKSLFADKMLEPEMLQQLTIITDEDIPKTLSFVHSSIEKMDSLINGLLQLSRTGRVEMNIQKIDMNALFATILQSLDFQIKESQCKIHINPLAGCYGDAALLDQLFANIISNALKYADSERPLEITIDAKNIHNKLVYTIRDTGKGIEQKYLDKIWDIFYRIDPRSGKTGEGIGLSLVKRIAEKHKGKVWVESEENKGSVFHIELHNRKFTEF